MKKSNKYRFRGLYLYAFVALFFFAAAGNSLKAACTPTSAEMCVAIDDIAEVWINGNFIGEFEYVNWDETGVYPTCVTINPDILEETDNVIAIKVQNTECCEIWGSWTIEISCEDGSHSCLSSDDAGMRLYPVLTPSTDPPPDDVDNGNEWWEKEYDDTDISPWQDAVVDTGTIYGKLIFNPCTGARLQPLSYDTGGNAEEPDMHIYMRQPFSITPVPTLPPTEFTITKSAEPTTDIDTGDRVTYTLVVCNTGQYTTGDVVVTDDFDDGFSFDGPYGGDCDGYGDGSPCYRGHGGYFTATWKRGFEGMTCVTLTTKVVDYWVDSSEWCEERDNVAGVHWEDAAEDASSNTVTVQMICPGTYTYTPTFTPSFTRTNTHTDTPTSTYTPTQTVTYTKTRIPTYTETFTPFPTNHTLTFTPTITITMTPTFTVTSTNTPTATVTQTWVNAIELVKTQDKDEVPLGDTVQYCIEFTNVGANAASFNIWDTIPGPLDFLWCTEGCTGPVTYTDGECPGSPDDNCRVINWEFTNVPPGATGQVCFWVVAARLQTVFGPEYVPGTYVSYLMEKERKALENKEYFVFQTFDMYIRNEYPPGNI